MDPNYEKFNQTVRSLITRKVSDFKKEMMPDPEDESRPDEDPTIEESLGSDIIISYEVALAKDDLIGIEFTVSSYSAGAAHPNSYTEVVNFDLKNGKATETRRSFHARIEIPANALDVLHSGSQETSEGAGRLRGDGRRLD